MSRHPRLPAALLGAALLGTACSSASGDELTAPTIGTTTTVATEYSAPEPERVPDDGEELEGHDVSFAVATAIAFLEESEVVATAAPEEVEKIVSGYLHDSAPSSVLDEVLELTAQNQGLGLARWRHAVVETRVEELGNGDVIVEAWQVAVITLEPDTGPVRVAEVWARDTLTLTYTGTGWKIIDRVMRSGPTPEPNPAVLPDDGALLEERLDGFGDAHPATGS